MAMTNSPSSPTFHLGITMAGAVSAGAYTAGFIDYLLEALHLWEDKKNENRRNEGTNKYDPRIPMHNVVIDVVGGASAGGMVSMMFALASYNKLTPVKEKSYQKTGNILYDNWVLLDDDLDGGKTTLEKMLSTSDITHEVVSLLNTNPIDAIADRVFAQLPLPDPDYHPPFIAPDLRVLVTLCSLKGIPFEVKFNKIKSQNFDYIAGHRMYEHMIVAHFKKNFTPEDEGHFLPFEPHRGDQTFLKNCTKGTGAFPIGLKPTQFRADFKKNYIENCIKRNLDIEDEDCKIDILLDEPFFDFTNIDGGTINNEPYGEVQRILQNRYGESHKTHPQFGTLMIDPFPNFYDFENRAQKKLDEKLKTEMERELSIFQKNISQLVPAILKTLTQQVRVKRGTGFYAKTYKVLGFPVKRTPQGKMTAHPPLACGGLSGFGGFFDIEFRMHDYFLGRDNAKNIIRSFFSLEYNPENLHPLFENLPQEAIDTFRLQPKNKGGKRYFPLIPDLKLLEKDVEKNPFNYYYKNFPLVNVNSIENLRAPMKNRLKAILKVEVAKHVNGRLSKTLLKLFSNRIAKKMTGKIIAIILEDFEDRKMITNRSSKKVDSASEVA